MATLVIWALTVLIPVNGLIWLGMISETRKQKNIYRRMLELKFRRRY